jgi:hypothetical protein
MCREWSGARGIAVGVGQNMLGTQAAEGWVPATPVDRAAVQAELERVLSDPHFSSSKRYPSFLRFVVSHALTGHTDLLKERVLGLEVFGRPANYDTTTDPIVRVTAAEIRKRLEQYYQEAGHDGEIRIFLPAGSYVPQFSQPPGASGPTGTLEILEVISAAPHEAASAGSGIATAAETAKSSATSATAIGNGAALVGAKPRSWFTSAVAVIAATALVAGSIFLWNQMHPPVMKEFWAPFVNASEPVLFCIADQSQYSTIKLRDAADPQRETTLNDSLVTVIIDDVGPLINIAGLLRTYGKTYRVQGETTTSLTDLRRGPAVFIGAFDNSWTLRMTAPLRYHFANNPEMTSFWIEDREHPENRDFVLDRNVQQQTGTYKDYAIVARFVDPNTDQTALVVAGLGRGGTIAGGEFLVDSNRMNELAKHVSSGWGRKSVEIVLETQIIQGRSGPPRIASVHVW